MGQGRRQPSARQYYIANVDTPVCVARAAKAAGAERMILLSSAGVMGPESPPGGFFDDNVAAPYDDYTTSKYLAELSVQDLSSAHFSVFVLRPPMVYGRGAPGSFDRIVKWILRGWPLPLASKSGRRSVIGIGNLCDAIVSATLAAGISPGPMLVADPEPLQVSEFLHETGAALNRRVRFIPVPPTLLELATICLFRSRDLQRLSAPFELSGTRAATFLGWTPQYSTQQELRRALSVVRS